VDASHQKPGNFLKPLVLLLALKRRLISCSTHAQHSNTWHTPWTCQTLAGRE
jgi:hypothetical protein